MELIRVGVASDIDYDGLGDAPRLLAWLLTAAGVPAGRASTLVQGRDGSTPPAPEGNWPDTWPQGWPSWRATNTAGPE